MAAHLFGRDKKSLATNIYLIANANNVELKFMLPYLKRKKWYRFVDNSQTGERAITDHKNLVVLKDQYHYLVEGRSVVVLVGQ